MPCLPPLVLKVRTRSATHKKKTTPSIPSLIHSVIFFLPVARRLPLSALLPLPRALRRRLAPAPPPDPVTHARPPPTRPPLHTRPPKDLLPRPRPGRVPAARALVLFPLHTPPRGPPRGRPRLVGRPRAHGGLPRHAARAPWVPRGLLPAISVTGRAPRRRAWAHRRRMVRRGGRG